MKRNLLLTSMFLMLSFFISACSDGDFKTSYPVAEKDNTGTPIDFFEPNSLYGEYQILYYELKEGDTHKSNNCSDFKCIVVKLEEDSKFKLEEYDNRELSTDTRGIIELRLFNNPGIVDTFFINKESIVDSYTTDKDMEFSYEIYGDNSYSYKIIFNGAYDKNDSDVFKPENDIDKLKIEIK